MKAIKKVDNYKRIRIPVEFQNYLGWKVNDEIEVKVLGNEIILKKHENVSDLNVVNQNNAKEEPLAQPIKSSNENYSLVRNESVKPPTIEEYFRKNSKIELLNNKSELNNRLCPKCKNPIGDCRFKLDHKYICKNCKDKLKNKFKLDLLSRKEFKING